MVGLLDRLTGRFLYGLVSIGLTPSRWPWGSCGTVILDVKGRRSGRLHSTLVTTSLSSAAASPPRRSTRRLEEGP